MNRVQGSMPMRMRLGSFALRHLGKHRARLVLRGCRGGAGLSRMRSRPAVPYVRDTRWAESRGLCGRVATGAPVTYLVGPQPGSCPLVLMAVIEQSPTSTEHPGASTEPGAGETKVEVALVVPESRGIGGFMSRSKLASTSPGSKVARAVGGYPASR